MASPLLFSQAFDLPDGRRVRVLAYEDRSLRFRVSDSPYVLEEAFMSGTKGQQTILKLSPKTAR